MNRRDLLRSSGMAFSVGTASVLGGCSGGTGSSPVDGTISSTPTRSETATRTETDSPRPCQNTEETPTSATQIPATPAEGSLDTRIRASGHYMWFVLSTDQWGRQKTPYDIQQSCSRWLAVPTASGGIRCFVKDIDVDSFYPRNVGFNLHLGALGSIQEIRIPHEILQSGQFDPKLTVALFLDEDEDGDFFLWRDGGENPDRWQGIGDDEEAIKNFTADGELVIDQSTTFKLLNSGTSAAATIGGLKEGTIEYYNTNDSAQRQNRNIDATTNVALYVGLADTGEGDAVEAIIEDVSVKRTGQ